jgi:hypothetical protein
MFPRSRQNASLIGLLTPSYDGQHEKLGLCERYYLISLASELSPPSNIPRVIAFIA